jgi:predicted homoserine dehydrogenase-like protein
MIIVDRALEKLASQNKYIRVGMVGAGFMARGIALQLTGAVPGVRLVAISNRRIDGAKSAYSGAGVSEIETVENVAALDDAIGRGKYSVTQDPMLLCEAESIDVIIEVTGNVEFSSHVAMAAIRNRKHLILMNAELDGTVGPILKVYADRAGIVITNADGDQPGVIMNLYRFVKGMAVTPVLCGNIKGLQDPYRNPTTQEGFARKWGQNPAMVTSFADGTKISFEQAIVANATGMRVAKRGMHGPTVAPGTPLSEAVNWYPLEDLVNGPGIVDYVVGASPNPGVFVLGTHSNPAQQHYLDLYKLGSGPLYLFYTPYHLCHFEVHNTVARAVLFQDPTIAPLGAPTVDVVATAKTDLKRGQILDGIGHYLTYGQCENVEVSLAEGLLPMGLAEGCTLKRDIPKDQVLTYQDVDVPVGRLSDKLREEQTAHFFPATEAAVRPGTAQPTQTGLLA